LNDIPVPSGSLVTGALWFVIFTIISRFITTFTPLYFLDQGIRASLLPAINLSQISEFSLVVMALGLEERHIAPETKGLVSFAFVLLAALSTFGITKSDGLTRILISALKHAGLRDLTLRLNEKTEDPGRGGTRHRAEDSLIGFFRTASSLGRTAPEAEDLLRHCGR
jgi:Kef-type K+ transport system membrane component KefB